jgi:2'-5' RNA ligase
MTMGEFLVEVLLDSQLVKALKSIYYKNIGSEKYAPHMSLYGPAACNDLYKLKRDFFKSIEQINNEIKSMQKPTFTISGFTYFEGKKGQVVTANIEPSESLEKVTCRISDLLNKLGYNPPSWDKKGLLRRTYKKKYHITMLNGATLERASELCKILNATWFSETSHLSEVNTIALVYSRRFLCGMNLLTCKKYGRNDLLALYHGRLSP